MAKSRKPFNPVSPAQLVKNGLRIKAEHTELAKEVMELRTQLAKSEDARAYQARVIDSTRQEAVKNHALLNRPHRVLRIVEYVGPRQWVEDTVRNAVHGTRTFSPTGGSASITATTLHEYPEALDTARRAPTAAPGETGIATFMRAGEAPGDSEN